MRSRSGWARSSRRRRHRRPRGTRFVILQRNLSALAISLPRLTRRNPLAAIGVVFVIFFTLCAIFAPWIAPQDPAHINLATRLSPPSWAQPFGSDELGRDILSRIIYGSRIFPLGGTGRGG